MAGHSHWKQIKEQKGTADAKRGALFSKLLRAVSAAAKNGTDPSFNLRLRAAILKAREEKVPQDNIERAIMKAEETAGNLEEILMEAYGPGGAALVISGFTNNKNRTTQEIKAILRDNEGKWAEPGSVKWAFETIQTEKGPKWQAKFKQELDKESGEKLRLLVEIVESHDDIECVYTNIDESFRH